MKLFVLITFGILAINTGFLQAQTYNSVHYDTKDGLPSAVVYDVSQDKYGFMWFATENGLSRFDGKNFKTFTTKNGLPDNSILKVHGDNSGKVYLSPFTHDLYYYQDDSFYKVPVPDKYKVDLSTVTLFTNEGDKVLVLGLEHSYILQNNQLVSFSEKYNISSPWLFIVRSNDSLTILSSLDSIYYIYNSGRVKSVFLPNLSRTYLIFGFDELTIPLPPPKGVSFLKSAYLADNFFYMYIENYLYIYNSLNADLIYKIREDKFSNAFVDNEGNLWIATIGEGVYRFLSFRFKHMDFGGKNEIFSMAKINNQIIAGTDFSKIYNIPIRDSVATYLTTDLSAFIAASGNPISNSLKRNRVYALRSEGDNLFIGTDGFLLKKTGSHAPVFRNIFPVKDIDIKDKNLLVCTGQYVFLIDKQDMSIKDTLLRQRATCGVCYHGNYYIGTLGGLIKIDSATKKITVLYDLFPAFKERITAIKRGIHDDLWIATSGNGLIHFKDDKIIRTIKEEDGLTSDICTSLFIDSTLIWLGTSNGLNRIETGQEKTNITRFTSANGLGADFINSVLTTDSDVYVGTAAGLTTFSKNILAEKSVCMLNILEVLVNGKQLKKAGNYEFPYNTLNIQIDFTAVSLKSAGDITYYYQMEGLDNKWNTTTANFVNFPTLQPNHYTLYLKAANKFGIESETKTISIIIEPPWWQTWLFRIIVLVLIGLLVLGIYYYNIRNIKRKEEMKREMEARFAALEQRALQAQMNPHFIFNALNSIQTFILNLDAEGANNYLTNFASLIRQTLENSMQPLITISSELKYLETYLRLEKLRFRNKFRYEIHIDDSIDQSNTLLPGMLLQPYIENSIRHGIQHRKDNNGLILLTISKTAGDVVMYTINDNGVGRKKAAELKSTRHIEYQSRGTSINEKRIDAINSQFKIHMQVKMEDILNENREITGTSVTILIPSIRKQ
jgi:two-component sensor histidine kinase